jgi:hypothetical protein
LGIKASRRFGSGRALDAEMGVVEAGGVFQAVAGDPVDADMRGPDRGNAEEERPAGGEGRDAENERDGGGVERAVDDSAEAR